MPGSTGLPRWRLSHLAIATLLLAVLALGGITAAVQSVSWPPRPQGPLRPIGLALLLAASVVGIVRLRHRERAIERLLVEQASRDSQVCPWCGGTPTVTPTRTPATTPCCRRAPKSWTAADYRAWWGLVAASGRNAGAVAWPRGDQLLSVLGRWLPGTQTLFWTGLAMLPASDATPLDPIVLALLLGPKVLIGYGLDLAGRSTISVLTGPRVCSRCSYPCVGEPRPQRCPECGQSWLLATGTKAGSRQVDRPLLTAGMSILVAGALLQFAQLSAPVGRWLRSIQPTSSLLRVAAANGPGTMVDSDAAWAELAKRTLSPAEESLLFDQLLVVRRQSAFMSPSAKTWAQGYLARNLGSAEQLRRWRTESFEVTLEAPSSVRVGEQVRLRVTGTHHEELLPPAVGVTVHLGGVRTEGGVLLAPGGGRGFWSLEISQRKTVPEIDLVFREPGTHELRVRLWLVARSYGYLTNPIEWNEDGTPVLPADALWAEPVDLRHPITVLP